MYCLDVIVRFESNKATFL
jgi:hypothetical protein